MSHTQTAQRQQRAELERPIRLRGAVDLIQNWRPDPETYSNQAGLVLQYRGLLDFLRRLPRYADGPKILEVISGPRPEKRDIPLCGVCLRVLSPHDHYCWGCKAFRWSSQQMHWKNLPDARGLLNPAMAYPIPEGVRTLDEVAIHLATEEELARLEVVSL